MPVASAAMVTAQDHGLMDETPDPALLSRRGGFSSHGEDAAIMAVLNQRGVWRPVGFYVDVGAFHPFLFSNTAALSLLGWRGINVEPNPDMAERLRRARPDDVTLEAAAGAAAGRAELQMFSEWGSSNTLDLGFADMISTTQQVVVTRKVDVEVMTLLDVLDPVQKVLAAGGTDLVARVRNCAHESAAATAHMDATRGRSSFLGDRAKGHVDPGSRSMALLIGAICDSLSKT